MLRVANEKMDWLKCAADMLIGAEFLRWNQHELIEDELRDEEQADSDDEQWQPSWLKAKKETAQFRRAARTRAWKNVVAQFKDTDLDTFKYECSMWLNGQTPFHWPLEFPEVMVERGGFDAFVGNPPFLPGPQISVIFGGGYRDWVKQSASHAHGNSDLVCYFLLRAFSLVRSGGGFGLLATKSIREGDSRKASLNWLVQHDGQIHFAHKSVKWPGAANVSVAAVCIQKGMWLGRRQLDGRIVDAINDFLDEDKVQSKPPEACRLHGQGFSWFDSVRERFHSFGRGSAILRRSRASFTGSDFPRFRR